MRPCRSPPRADGVATAHVRSLTTPVHTCPWAQELAILRVWPFDRWCVDVFNVENQPPHGEDSILPPLLELLSPHGYRHLVRIGVDEVFQRDPPCSAGHTRRGARRLLKKSERRRRSA